MHDPGAKRRHERPTVVQARAPKAAVISLSLCAAYVTHPMARPVLGFQAWRFGQIAESTRLDNTREGERRMRRTMAVMVAAGLAARAGAVYGDEQGAVDLTGNIGATS